MTTTDWPRWIRRKAIPGWCLVALLLTGAVVWAVEQLAARHLATDAEVSAIGWAQYLARSVPEIDDLFAGDAPSAQTLERLRALHGAAGVFRFKVFSRDGRLVLLSDEMRRPDDESGSSPTARQVLLSGLNDVALKRGDGIKRPPLYSEAYVPVLHKDGAPIGVVEVYVDQSSRAVAVKASFRQAAAVAGLALGTLVALGACLWRQRELHQQQAETRLHWLTRHDTLTGAINRSSFHGTLEEACRAPTGGGVTTRFAVLCVDIDRFKDINDAHGHAAGDDLLRQAAERLRLLLRTGDRLARLAGDQFAVLQGAVDDSQAVTALAQRITAALARPYVLGGRDVDASASVGAAIHGTDGDDAATLLHHADVALFRAKSNGRAGYAFYDAALDRQLHDRRSLAHDLRGALAAGALQLHFQPLWAADGRTLLGYEALTRWPHPTRGFVPPSDFIPLAEETGLIDALGRWVLSTACAEAARWPAPLSVAVNLSPAQFKRGGEIEADVAAALAAAQLSPSRLELEITESLLMVDTEQVLRSLHALRESGVRIAMDDFGTGYSSLAYLWRFPFDKVKIDRAFTHGLGGDGRVDLIVRSIVSMAHSLSIRVNAEGVETDSQRAALAVHGCDEMQGFLLGRPMPVERLAHLAVREDVVEVTA